MTAGLHALPASPGNTVSTSCAWKKGKLRIMISVANHGTVPRAADYFLNVTDPDCSVQRTVFLTPSRVYDVGTSNSAVLGNWTHSIEAQYGLPNSVWKSDPAPVVVGFSAARSALRVQGSLDERCRLVDVLVRPLLQRQMGVVLEHSGVARVTALDDHSGSGGVVLRCGNVGAVPAVLSGYGFKRPGLTLGGEGVGTEAHDGVRC